MKAIQIREETLRKIARVNDGVRPVVKSGVRYFVYDPGGENMVLNFKDFHLRFKIAKG